MNRDEIFPETASVAPPGSLDEAVVRVANAIDLHRLVFKAFGSTFELRKALAECGYNMREPRGMLVGSQIRTLLCEVVGKDSSEFKMVLNEVGDSWVQVINVLQTKRGDAQSPDDYKALKDITG